MIFTLTDRNYNALDAYETDNYLIGKYVGSILETLDIEVAVTSLNAQYWIQGNYIMCVDTSGHKYWFTIYDADDASNEDTKTISCYSGTIDIVSEEYPPIKATQTQPFEWYFNRIFLDTGIVLGVNEISTLTRKLEFESTNTTNVEMLQYVLNGFDNAEASLDVTFDGVQPTKLVLNVYRRIGSEMPQELLSTETDNLTKLERKGSISELATAMRATGQEVNEKMITLKGKYYEEKDSKGNILYYSPKDRSEVFSLVGHQNFYVNLPGKGSGEFDGYIVRDYQSQAKTQDALWTQTLAQLKKVDHANIEYLAEGYISCGIGDNIQLVALDMQPPVMVSARVTEYKFNDDDPTQNKYKFSNFVDLEGNMSELDKIIAEIKKDIDYVVDTVTEYGQSVDNVKPPTEWTDELLDVPQGNYQWTRITQTMFKGGVNIAYLTAYVPFDGEKGDDGADGLPGKDGVGVKSTEITYALSTSGTTAPTSGWSTNVPNIPKGQYLWTRTIWTYTDDSSEAGYSVAYMAKDGNDGSDGVAGKDGVGIANTKVEYVGSTSGTTKPTSGWATTIPTVPEGKFLWTKITWTYTDNTIEIGYSVAKAGETGSDGKTTYLHTAYANSADGTVDFTREWPRENLLDVESDKLREIKWSSWNIKFGGKIPLKEKQAVTASVWYENVKNSANVNVGLRLFYYREDGSLIFESPNSQTSVAVGESGTAVLTDTTPEGTSYAEFVLRVFNGKIEGTASYKHAKLELGSTATPYLPEGETLHYIGTYTDFNEQGSDDPSKYEWVKFVGENGKDGKDGSDGKDGQSATEVVSGYLTNEAMLVPANPQGVVSSFANATGQFVVTEGNKTISTGITFAVKSTIGCTASIDAKGNYKVTAMTADLGTIFLTAKYKDVTVEKVAIITKAKQGTTGSTGSPGKDGSDGKTGSPGKDGKGIKSTTVTYQAGTSGTTTPTGSWVASPPNVSANQYLWTRTVITYTDNTTTTAYSVGKMGANGTNGKDGTNGAPGKDGKDGEQGEPGVGVKSTVVTYQQSSSGTTTPQGTWSSSVPNVTKGNYLWTKTVTTYTDNSTNTGYSVSYFAKDGSKGDKGDPTGITVSATVPTTKYTGMLWKHTGSVSGYIKDTTYRWNGSKWEIYTFSVENLIAATLSAITANLGNITSGTINGSKFINTFTNVPVSNGSSSKASGTTTLANGILVMEGKIDNTFPFRTEYSPTTVSQVVYNTDGSVRTNQSMSVGELFLQDSLGNNGILTAENLQSVNWSNIPLANGAIISEGNTPQYRKTANLDGTHTVELRGQVGFSAGKAQSATLGTLPTGIRPIANMMYQQPCNHYYGARIAVLTSGALQFRANWDTEYVALTGIRFSV